MEPDLYDAVHPLRRKAILILEFFQDRYGVPADGVEWYAAEDAVTEILAIKEEYGT